MLLKDLVERGLRDDTTRNQISANNGTPSPIPHPFLRA